MTKEDGSRSNTSKKKQSSSSPDDSTLRGPLPRLPRNYCLVVRCWLIKSQSQPWLKIPGPQVGDFGKGLALTYKTNTAKKPNGSPRHQNGSSRKRRQGNNLWNMEYSGTKEKTRGRYLRTTKQKGKRNQRTLRLHPHL